MVSGHSVCFTYHHIYTHTNSICERIYVWNTRRYTRQYPKNKAKSIVFVCVCVCVCVCITEKWPFTFDSQEIWTLTNSSQLGHMKMSILHCQLTNYPTTCLPWQHKTEKCKCSKNVCIRLHLKVDRTTILLTPRRKLEMRWTNQSCNTRENGLLHRKLSHTHWWDTIPIMVENDLLFNYGFSNTQKK